MKRHFKTNFLLILSLIFSPILNSQINSSNPKIEKEINDLISKMSLEEKCGQTCQITLDAILKTDSKGAAIEPMEIDQTKLDEAILKYHVGSILNVSSHTLKMSEWQIIMDKVHASYRAKKTKTPILYGVDAIHGVNYTVGGTLFPQEIGLAATWNPELAKRFGEITAYELRASGVPWNFSPVLDLGRQPLWSRFFETLGEDPYLASLMGASIIKGYQGTNLADKHSTLSCMKHFVGYSHPLSGRDRTPAWIPERYLTEYYLPSFEAAVKAGALTVMVNSGELNGIPGHINYHLLTKLLKEKWGFQGFAVSDWEDFIMLETVHHVAENQKEAISMSINAGLDMSMVPNSPMYKEYCTLLKEAVEEGLVSEERLNDAVRRILRVKKISGIFEKQTYPLLNYPAFGSENFKNSALESAEESITLLKNSETILPLKKGSKILVSGPTANNLIYLNGAWSHTWQGVDTSYNTKNCKTIYEAFKTINGSDNTSLAKGAELFFEKGWEESRLVDLEDFKRKVVENDVIVICLGELPSTEKPGDIRSLNLPEAQMDLVKIAYEFKKKVILVLTEGRPRIIHNIVDGADAIIQTYLPGDYGGEALAKIIFGDVNPSGKLPYSYPKYDGIIEHYDHKKSEARSGKTANFDAYDPEWDFGFGLSYSNFEYTNLTIDKTQYLKADSIRVSIDVKNVSKVDGKEVVQLYVSDLVSKMVPNGKKLKQFQKINLKAGEIRTVNFVLSADDLKFVNQKNEWELGSGEFQISIQNMNQIFKFN